MAMAMAEPHLPPSPPPPPPPPKPNHNNSRPSSSHSPSRVHKRAISDQQKRRDLALQRQRQGRRDLQYHARRVVSFFLSQEEEHHSSISYQEDEEEEEQNRCFSFSSSSFSKVELEFVEVQQQQQLSDVAMVSPQKRSQKRETDDLMPDSGFVRQEKEVILEEEEKQQKKEKAPKVKFGDVGEGEIRPEKDEISGIPQAAGLKGRKAQDWFKQQFMLPEWMVDVPSHLKRDWYVLARPAGDRCIVVSSGGRTVSRTRNGRVLHIFPSALPNGVRGQGSNNAHEFCILDCVFHKPNSTYYIIDMMCWRGYPLYDCTYEFRHFWIESKLAEIDALDKSSTYNRYGFSIVPAYKCDVGGLQAAYSGPVPFERDGCLFLNKHAHYVLGTTPLALMWKDSTCSRYCIDTDRNGNIPAYQQVVLELQVNGTVATCDDPPVALGSMPQQFLEQNSQHLKPGMLLKFAIGDQGLTNVNGRPIAADIQYKGLANRFRAGADSVSKVLFQYAARHAPMNISDIIATVSAPDDDDDDDDDKDSQMHESM